MNQYQNNTAILVEMNGNSGSFSLGEKKYILKRGVSNTTHRHITTENKKFIGTVDTVNKRIRTDSYNQNPKEIREFEDAMNSEVVVIIETTIKCTKCTSNRPVVRLMMCQPCLDREIRQNRELASALERRYQLLTS